MEETTAPRPTIGDMLEATRMIEQRTKEAVRDVQELAQAQESILRDSHNVRCESMAELAELAAAKAAIVKCGFDIVKATGKFQNILAETTGKLPGE